MATVSSCSLCGSISPIRKKFLDNAVEALDELIVGMIEARGDESGAVQLQKIHQEVNERKGFVCYSCLKVLNTYHGKRQQLLLKLEQSLDLQLQRSGSQDHHSHDSAASAPKRRKLSLAESGSNSPEVIVSN